MAAAELVKFDGLNTTPETYYIDADKLISGNPKQSLWNHYSDATGQFFSGEWHSEVGKWRINYTEEEYCRLLEGVSVITDAAGNATTLRAGDSFVVPGGFSGTWEVLEPTRKLYAIYQQKAD